MSGAKIIKISNNMSFYPIKFQTKNNMPVVYAVILVIPALYGWLMIFII